MGFLLFTTEVLERNSAAEIIITKRQRNKVREVLELEWNITSKAVIRKV